MNPAYWTVRFRVQRPADGLPPVFGIVTAWNPEGGILDAASNETADRSLAARIDAAGWRRFRVTGGSPDFSHAEPGWGIAAPAGGREGVLALGREFHQVAIYWVEDGTVFLQSCGPDSAVHAIGLWADLSETLPTPSRLPLST